MLRTKIVLSGLALTVSTCATALKERVLGHGKTDPSQDAPIAETKTTAPKTQGTQTGASSSDALKANASNSAAGGAPTAPPIQINSGRAILASGKPYQTFVHLVPVEQCRGEIFDRIAYFPELQLEGTEAGVSGSQSIKGATVERDEEDDEPAERASIATSAGGVLTREGCADVEPRTLNPGSFELVSPDGSGLIYAKKLFNRSDRASEPLVVYCKGATDGGGRDVRIEVRRKNTDGSMKARIVMKGSGPAETLELPVSVTTKDKMTLYKAGAPGAVPYLAIALGDFNGLTAFVSYELRFTAPGQLTRKEANLSFPSCAIP